MRDRGRASREIYSALILIFVIISLILLGLIYFRSGYDLSNVNLLEKANLQNLLVAIGSAILACLSYRKLRKIRRERWK